ncbi:MAG TPA: hypothetical protein VFY16_06230, partial [Gemmatimonadaceae bacterium]|nr:hypothetical protein [Gemmatimonadaceae bacterium]
GDVTGDGHVDLVVGNLGLNTRLQASEREPVTMYVHDFDRNSFVEQVVATYSQGESRPLVLRDDLLRGLPFLKSRLLAYEDYAGKSVTEVFTAEELAGALERRAYTFASTLARGDGRGGFTLEPLPREAQLAPVYGILADDVDGDGRTDLLLAGNFDGLKPEIGRASASYGLLLRGDGGGRFTSVPATRSGFRVMGEARDIRRLRAPAGALYVVARNDDRPLLFRRAGSGARVIARGATSPH